MPSKTKLVDPLMYWVDRREYNNNSAYCIWFADEHGDLHILSV